MGIPTAIRNLERPSEGGRYSAAASNGGAAM